MTNLIKWEAYTPTEREIIGTLAEVAGKGTGINFVKENFLNPAKRLMLVLKKSDGTSTSITCSPKVGELVRSKEITMSQLAGFPVCEQVTQDGELFAQIQMPSGQGLISANVINEVQEYEVENVELNDLVAF